MIKIRDISKKYCDNYIFKDINFNFENGIYVLRGRNGRGKSTLLRIIAGIEKPTTGEVVLESSNNRILFLNNQGIGIPFLSIEDNIKFSAKIIKLDVNGYYELFNNDLNLLKKSYEISSLGNKMKVGLSLLFSKEKFDFIILDEAFNGLDSESIEYIKRRIYKLAKNTTIIIVTHNEKFDKSIEILIDDMEKSK